jgi:hypothetical protein
MPEKQCLIMTSISALRIVTVEWMMSRTLQHVLTTAALLCLHAFVRWSSSVSWDSPDGRAHFLLMKIRSSGSWMPHSGSSTPQPDGLLGGPNCDVHFYRVPDCGRFLHVRRQT